MTSVVSSITEVFTSIGTWFVNAITLMQPVFYAAETGLTFIGTLTVVGLAIAVILLVMAMIRSYLRLQ